MKFIRDIDGNLINLTQVSAIVFMQSADSSVNSFSVEAYGPEHAGESIRDNFTLFEASSEEETTCYVQRLTTQLGRNGLFLEVQ